MLLSTMCDSGVALGDSSDIQSSFVALDQELLPGRRVEEESRCSVLRTLRQCDIQGAEFEDEVVLLYVVHVDESRMPSRWDGLARLVVVSLAACCGDAHTSDSQDFGLHLVPLTPSPLSPYHNTYHPQDHRSFPTSSPSSVSDQRGACRVVADGTRVTRRLQPSDGGVAWPSTAPGSNPTSNNRTDRLPPSRYSRPSRHTSYTTIRETTSWPIATYDESRSRAKPKLQSRRLCLQTGRRTSRLSFGACSVLGA